MAVSGSDEFDRQTLTSYAERRLSADKWLGRSLT